MNCDNCGKSIPDFSRNGRIDQSYGIRFIINTEYMSEEEQSHLATQYGKHWKAVSGEGLHFCNECFVNSVAWKK